MIPKKLNLSIERTLNIDLVFIDGAAVKMLVVFALVRIRLDIVFIDGVAVNISEVFVSPWFEFAVANWKMFTSSQLVRFCRHST
jgi:hypothetical protein